MENASKALIIAGAILISILIIGLGVFIYQQASTTVSNANLNSQEAMAHNGPFQNYIGNNTASASDVKSLMQLVISNNVTGTTADTVQYIYIHFETNSGRATTSLTDKEYSKGYIDPAVLSSFVASGYTYKIFLKNTKATTTSQEQTVTTGSFEPNPTETSYYSNGYIREIWIEENSRGGNGTSTNP